MNYKIPIIPYNEFWLDCDTETLYSIIYSMNQKYKVHFYENNYTYDLLRVPSPSGEFFGEIRLHQQFIELREKVLDIVEKRRFNNVTNAIDTIKKWIENGYLVQAGVDLYYWIEGNCCYNKHHVEHYTEQFHSVSPSHAHRTDPATHCFLSPCFLLPYTDLQIPTPCPAVYSSIQSS